MKLTICLLAGIAALCIASAYARQQAPPFNESLAYARLLRAHKLPSVTHGQCVSAQNDWLEKDKADKQDGPYWYQKISTEDLVQLTSLSTACATEATGRQATSNGTSVGAFVARARQFEYVALDRAETVLHNHSLIEEYLLQP